MSALIRRRCGLAALSITLLGTASACLANTVSCVDGYVCTVIDYPPGGTSTWLSGINDAGQIVGWYTDRFGERHGFLVSAGNTVPIDAPGALDTAPMGINNRGQIVGVYTDDTATRGFLFDGVNFHDVSAGSGSPTAPAAINDAGEIVGQFASHGFTAIAGAISYFDVPGASKTQPYGVNLLGQIVGAFTAPGTDLGGFEDSGGTFQTILITGNRYTQLDGISDGGQMVGTFGTYEGFRDTAGTIQLFEVFNSNGTYVSATNNAGQIVGWYYDAVNPSFRHGFLATPVSTSPVILFNGYDDTGRYRQNLDITGRALHAAVGQKISLIAEVPGAVQSQAWHIAGKPIGGYSATPASYSTGAVLPWIGNGNATNFYWTIPSGDRRYVVEYSYVLANGQSGTIESRFDVVGPSDAAVNVVSTNPGQVFDNRAGQYQGFATPWILLCGVPDDDTEPCFQLHGSATVPDGFPNSSFQWVQTIRSQIVRNFSDAPPAKCVSGPGLDNTYPYLALLDGQPQDSPGAGVQSDDPAKSLSVRFQGRMYFMWNSGLPDSIPVPLGYSAWVWTDEARHAADGSWKLRSQILNYPSFAAFADVPLFPTWTMVTQNGVCS